jgi:hypothetical protein
VIRTASSAVPRPSRRLLVFLVAALTAGCVGALPPTAAPEAEEVDPAAGPSRSLPALPARVVAGGHTGPVLDASFSHDGASLITAGSDGHVHVWDIATGVRT